MIPSMDADRYLRIARLAALKDAAALTDALDALTDSPDQIATTLRAHHIASLVHASLDSPSERAWFGALLDAIDRLTRFPFPTATECMTGFDEVRERLGARDVDVLLLKGVYFAERLYGGSRWRPQFDVDILIPAAARRRAHRTLIDAGFQRTAYDLHSATFSRDRLKVDVHAWLRRAPAYHLDERLIWSTARCVTLADREVRTLSDEYALVMVVLSTFEDLGQGMARLKQFVDAYLLLRQMDASTDWAAFFDRRTRENVGAIAVVVLDLLVQLFEAAGEVPRLSEALEARRGSFATMTRPAMLDLVFAARKDPRSMEWFRNVYPGTLSRYLLWFWVAGFPANVTVPSLSHAIAAGRVAFGRGRTRSAAVTEHTEPEGSRITRNHTDQRIE